MVARIFWGLSLVLIGLLVIGYLFPGINQAAGASLVVAGLATILGY